MGGKVSQRLPRGICPTGRFGAMFASILDSLDRRPRTTPTVRPPPEGGGSILADPVHRSEPVRHWIARAVRAVRARCPASILASTGNEIGFA